MIQEIKISDIAVPQRLRNIDADWVKVLAASIAANGLQQPVTVRRREGRLLLVVGEHRLEACRSLGWSVIAADDLGEVDDDTARILEIDENLVRRDLSALDRAVFLAERQAVWLRLYPETAEHVAGGKGKAAAANFAAAYIGMPSFAEAVAEKTDLKPRSIRGYIALARALDPQAREQLGRSGIADNASALKRIAALGGSQQRQVAALIAGGTRFADALAQVVPAAPRDPVADQTAALLTAWGRAGGAARARFLTSIGAAIGAQDSAIPQERE